MSACISMHGEYSNHIPHPDANYTCVRCGVLDEDALIAERDRLRAEVQRQHADLQTYEQEVAKLNRTIDELAADLEDLRAVPPALLQGHIESKLRAELEAAQQDHQSTFQTARGVVDRLTAERDLAFEMRNETMAALKKMRSERDDACVAQRVLVEALDAAKTHNDQTCAARILLDEAEAARDAALASLADEQKRTAQMVAVVEAAKAQGWDRAVARLRTPEMADHLATAIANPQHVVAARNPHETIARWAARAAVVAASDRLDSIAAVDALDAATAGGEGDR